MNSLLRGRVMYAYRKLTPEEREEILRLRRARGFPLHSPPHLFRDVGSYLITTANFEHQHVMHLSERRTDFESRLLKGLRTIEARVYGWVVLSNHYHVLLGVDSLDAVSATLKQLHGRLPASGMRLKARRDCGRFGIASAIGRFGARSTSIAELRSLQSGQARSLRVCV